MNTMVSFQNMSIQVPFLLGNSYYVYTWKEMSVTVNVSGNAGISGEKPSAGVSLSLFRLL